jgi:hypothetical protein
VTISWRTAGMLASSLITAINVLVASGFSIAGIVSPQSILSSTDSPNHASLIFALYAAARTIPHPLFALAAIYKQAVVPLMILGALAGVMQLLDAGVGLVQGDFGKTIGPLAIAALQFAALYYLHRAKPLPSAGDAI